MRITTIGRGTIGGTLAGLWRGAGHEVTELGRDGGDASGAEVVLVAVPYGSVPEALAGVTGLDGGQVILDATNRLGHETPPEGHASMSEYLKAATGAPVAKVFNLNFGALLERAKAEPVPPHNLWVGDEAARAAVETLTRDVGMAPVNAGPLENAVHQEAFAFLLVALTRETGGLVYSRYAGPAA
jgi:8-hydroxy-5-deazaflavin:NADPH oxidoreductase